MSDTPLSDAAIADFPAFVRTMRDRLESGKAAYGDIGFHFTPSRLCAEMQQECLDIANYSYMMYRWIADLERRWRSQETLIKLGMSDAVMEEVLMGRTDASE